jgi:very-short-patch-repair endonuclease
MKTSPEIFKQFCVQMGLPAPVAELQFEPLRKWRFDYSWPDAKIALEVEGGIWTGGRHTSSAGFIRDLAKYNRAACLGWRVLRVQPKELLTLQVVQMVKEARCAN